MDEINNIIDDLGIESFEGRMKLAGFAVISDSGDLVAQTENFNLKGQTNIVSEVVNGATSFELSGGKFTIVESSETGIIADSNSMMGHVLFTSFKGGILISYSMPESDTAKILSFLKEQSKKLDGKI